MSLQQERPPALYTTSHEPNSLELPSVPQSDLSKAVPVTSVATTLPDLRSLNLPAAIQAPNSSQNGFATKGHTQLSAAAFPAVPSTAPKSMTEDIGSPMEVESVMSADDQTIRGTSVSMENPDEADAIASLSALRNADVRSPPAQNRNIPQVGLTVGTRRENGNERPEPFLSLLTSKHPLLGGSINGSLSAYSSTKSYSPRFIKYGAEYVERNVGSPLANTVGSIGRRTGVEGHIRRYLGDRRLSDTDQQADAPSKRRRVTAESTPAPDATIDGAMDVDMEKGFETPSVREFHSRRQSQASSAYAESLPAYDENRSPQYEERPGEQLLLLSPQDEQQRQGNHSWSTQLMISTSGLGVALSESSLRSLKACLGMLRGATTHISNVMQALAMVLADYEAATRPQYRDAEQGNEKQQLSEKEMMHQQGSLTPEQQESSRQIAERIKALSDDIWRTIQKVVNSVSHYTGGALPDNARALVRRQLMSVPLRWRVANQTANGNGANESQNGSQSESSEPSRSAHRMLAFAKEGLDMIAQVSAVVDGTVGSAEKWLDSLGRRRQDGPSEKNGFPVEQSPVNGVDEKREFGR